MSYPQLDVRERQDLAPQHPSLHAPSAHVSLADRLALRVGLWLILRSTQHVQHRTAHAEHLELVRRERSREARELSYERSLRQQRPAL
ncbi:hypothetical protein [Microbacterium sp.]|uniref:hypothetical protein n=1 Tax=Microbacterium sp. TaxID=51671 RepID=UPI0037C635DF